jgi:nitrous oxidase accessory protein
LSRKFDLENLVSDGFSQGTFTKTPLKHNNPTTYCEQNMSKHAAPLLALMLLAACFLYVPLPSEAANRTVVVPDDYPTVKDAIGNAKTGDTILIKKGTYDGPAKQTIAINMSISVVGEDADNTIINLHPPLVSQDFFSYSFPVYLNSISIEADNVQLRSLTIRSDRISEGFWGNGGAISLAGDHVEITDNTLYTSISGSGNQTLVRNNRVAAIKLQGSEQIVEQNTVAGEVGEGEYLVSCTGSNNTVAANNVSGGIGGIVVGGSSNYVSGNTVNTSSLVYLDLAVGGDRNIICCNNVSSLAVEGQLNSFFGNRVGDLSIKGNGNVFHSNLLAGVGMGDTINDASNNTFYGNNFVFGEVKAFTIWSGAKGDNFLDNGMMGNFWSDYNGFDWNLDGVGDTPYVVDAKDPLNYYYIAESDIADVVLTDHYPLMAALDISSSVLEPTPTGIAPEPFPTVPILIVVVAGVAVVGASLLLYRKRGRGRTQ